MLASCDTKQGGICWYDCRQILLKEKYFLEICVDTAVYSHCPDTGEANTGRWLDISILN